MKLCRLLLLGLAVFFQCSSSNDNHGIDYQELQLFQKNFDERYFEINNGFEKLRHILLHLMKTVGKMATYCEIKEHGKTEPDTSQLLNEVLPDLLIHALQIANHYHIDLGEKYAERLQFIVDRANKSFRSP